MKPGAHVAPTKPGSVTTWAQHKANQKLEAPHLAEKLRHVYNTKQGNGVAGQNPQVLRQFSSPLPFRDGRQTLQQTLNGQSSTSGLPSSPAASPVAQTHTSRQQDDALALAGVDATRKADFVSESAMSETIIAEVSPATETRRQFSSDSEYKPRRSFLRQTSFDSDDRPRKSFLRQNSSGNADNASKGPRDGSPATSDLERDVNSRKQKPAGKRNTLSVDDVDSDSPSGLPQRGRRGYTSRFRSDSGYDSDAPKSEMTWRNEMENKLEDLGEDLACINEGIEDDFNILKDDVSELTRMMHQLLTRFDAEEKY